MKRWVIVGVGLLVAGAFAAGNAVPKLKFPYGGPVYNQPAGKTLLEWQCLAGRVDCRPFVLNREWHITALLAEPMPGGVRIKINIEVRKNILAKAAAATQQAALYGAQCRMEETILAVPKKLPAGLDPQLVDTKPFTNLTHTRIEFYVAGRLLRAKGLTLAQLEKR